MIINIRRILCMLMLLTITEFTLSQEVSAIPANPAGFTVVQPDGTRVQIRLRGDEWFHVEETVRGGYTVIQDRGWYVYARRDAATGHLVSTGLRVGQDRPSADLKPGETPSAQARAERAAQLGIPTNTHQETAQAKRRNRQTKGPSLVSGADDSTSSSAPQLAGVATSGTLKNLVVMIRWSDHGGRAVPSQVDVNVLMNNNGPHALAPTGSVRDVYLENSYGALSLESTVAAWVTSNNTEAYYGNGNSGLTSLTHDALKDALNKVDQFIDFRDFDSNNDGIIDAITFLHSGYGAEWGGSDAYGTNYTNRIWSHKWSIFGGWTSQEGVSVYDYHISPAVWGTSGSNIGRIGVIAHETGHFLGLPDLYDTDGSGSGIGSYGLMANSWGFDGSQFYPPHFSPWSKVNLGWLTPTPLETSGSYDIHQAETNAQVYKITQGYPNGEYLFIENRQPTGFDGAMPQGGLVIWHIDESAGYYVEGYPSNGSWSGSHYRVAVLQADGAYDLEHGYDRGDAGDVWHANGNSDLGPSDVAGSGPFPNTDAYQGGSFVQTNHRIHNISAAGSTMSFTYQLVGEPVDPPTAPSDLIAVPAGYDTIDLGWSDNSFDEQNFIVERATDGVNFSTRATLSAEVSSYTDTGLNANTTYYYRVYARNTAGDSASTLVAVATTEPPPPPPVAPQSLQASATSDASIALTWVDASNDESTFVVERSENGTNWTPIATLSANSEAYTDNGLTAETTYSYRVSAQNIWGNSTSSVASATTEAAPAYVDSFADLDLFVNGSMSGTYADLAQADGITQILTEIESGGKPANRYSYAEHQWRFSNVRGGLAITAYVTAWAPANSDQDSFDIEVSSNGSNWSPLLTIYAGSTAGSLFSAQLPSTLSGTYYLRITDTDRTRGNRSFDRVYIDQIFFRTDLDPNDSPPNPPANLTATALSASRIDLSWSDLSDNERGFNIYRSSNGGSSLTYLGSVAANVSTYSDTSVAPNGAYMYQVEAFTTSFSALSNTASAVTPDGISLSGSGSKRRGKAIADLTWIGGSSAAEVEIFRSINGQAASLLTRLAHNGGGSYTDNTGLGGSNTIRYQVCTPADLGAVVCSEVLTLIY